MENEDADEDAPLYIECGVCGRLGPHGDEIPVGWRYAQVTAICEILVCSEACQRAGEDRPA